MTITPVVAGLLGTVIGAVASIAASVLTQRATNARERDHKLWERRADALEEIHRYTLARKNTRGWVMASKRLPDDWDPNRPQEPVRLLETKVALYAPVAVSDAYKEWGTKLVGFVLAVAGYQSETARLSGSPEPEGAQILLEASWAMAEHRAREWEQAEDRLFKVLRDASILRPERQWRLRR